VRLRFLVTRRYIFQQFPLEIHMKTSLALAVGSVFLFAAGMPLAQDAKVPAQSPKATASQAGSKMPMGSQMGQMDEHMKKMQTLHERMASATTPEERQKVMEEQRKEMQAGMGVMNQMQGGGMMGGMGGGMMAQKGRPADQETQMQMMEKRMDMMQMMMQTMMDQQGMTAGPKVPDAAPKK
jgi:hypothetical protein